MSLRHQEEGDSSVTSPPPPQPEFDVHMPDVNPSIAPSDRFQFGINSMNNLLSQMPEQPVLNIQCQTYADIENAIQMLGQWVLYKKHQDSNLTGQCLGMQLVAGLSDLAFEW